MKLSCNSFKANKGKNLPLWCIIPEIQGEQLCPQLSTVSAANLARARGITPISAVPLITHCRPEQPLLPVQPVPSSLMGLSLHQWVGKDATATRGSGTWLGAALRITQVTATEMSSDKRLTVQLGSPGCHREQLPGEGRGLPFPGGKQGSSQQVGMPRARAPLSGASSGEPGMKRSWG